MKNPSMTLYDMAKQIISNETPMDPIIFNQKMIEIGSDMAKYKYSMLLCKERADYTIFYSPKEDKKKYAIELSECLKPRGDVLVADYENDDNGWEIWIRDPDTKENFLYKLFNYSMGVVEV